jgi:putative aldouronate transport system substrate-binding protein
MMKRVLILLLVLFTAGLSAFAAGGQQGAGTSAGGIPGDKLPLGKYNPPITVYSAKSSLSSSVRFEAGDTMDKNSMLQFNMDQLGIDVKWKWVGTADDQGQKMTAAIASGDLPDIFAVNYQQFDMLARGGLIWDLTDIYETYADTELRRITDAGPIQQDTAKIDGRLYGLPVFGSDLYYPRVWVRQDWIDKLGLPNPDSMQNLIKIAEAFATQDPDGNGRNDTIGLLVQSAIFGGDASLEGFFAGYHAFPTGVWLKDSADKLIPGMIQPENKTALTTLVDLYKRGIIDREFVSRDAAGTMELLISGKAGLLIAGPHLPLAYPNIGEMNPGMVFNAYPIPSADNKKATFIINNPVSAYFVVNKKFAHPEALIKLMNLDLNTNAAPPGTPNPFLSTPNGYEYYNINILHNDIPNVNLYRYRAIQDAFTTGDSSKLNSIMYSFYEQMVRYYSKKDTIPADWAAERFFGADHSSCFVKDIYDKNRQTSLNPYFGPPTATMIAREGNLNAMRDEVFTKIIIGELPISAYDTFISDWKRQGGDQITKEVNDWYDTHK